MLAESRRAAAERESDLHFCHEDREALVETLVTGNESDL